MVFEPDVHDIELLDGTALAGAWWKELIAACSEGPGAAQSVANRHRGTLDDAQADELGVRLVELLALEFDPPGRLGVLASVARTFAGPRTIAATGQALRRDLQAAEWKIEAGFGVLTARRNLEAAVQARLCSRDAREVEVLVRAHHLYRGWTTAMLDLLGAAQADAPMPDLERYFALNLQDAMIWGTRFRGREIIAAANTPLRRCLSRLVWGTYQRGRLTDLFRVDPEEDDFLDAEADPFELDSNAQIGVPHRAEMSPEQLHAWGATFADFEIVGLFLQLDRELIAPEPNFPYQSIERTVDEDDVLRLLHSAGWTRRRDNPTFQYPLRGASLLLQTSSDGQYRTLHTFDYRSTSPSDVGPDATISYSEALAAAVNVLDTLAPDLV